MKNFELIENILREFYVKIHQVVDNNWDSDRFGYLGEEAKNTILVDWHIAYLQLLLAKQEEFEFLFEILADYQSKEWLRNVLLFRLLGHLHFRLPTNSDYHWRVREEAKKLSIGDSELDCSGLFGSFQKFSVNFEGQINLDCLWQNVAWTFLFKQYYFNRNGIRIQPEPGDIVIDAGACFGDTSLAFAASVGKAGKVFAFEILPDNLEIIFFNLMQNPKLNPIIEINDYGLSSESGIMYLHGEGEGTFVNQEPSENSVTVTTIDEFVSEAKLDRVDFIKMDIEGSELNALKGAINTILKFQPKLAISVYHKPDDIINIPMFINNLNLGYKLYIDHYTIFNEETVLYAVRTAD